MSSIERPDVSSQKVENKENVYEVIVVGAGMSGLSTAYNILSKKPGTKLAVIESRDRVGGRVHSHTIHTSAGDKRVDLGASFIHGVDGNPMVDLATKLNLPWRRSMLSIGVVRADGSIVDPEIVAGMGPRLFGTLFQWMGDIAQNGDEVPKATENIRDRIFSEDSPIFQDPPEMDAETTDEISHMVKPLVRGFQGWTGAPLDYVSLKWWMFNQDTEGGDGVLLDGYGGVLDWLTTEIQRLGGTFKLKSKVTEVELEEAEDEDENESKQSTVLEWALLDKVLLVYENAWWENAEVFKENGGGPLSQILLPEKGDEDRLFGPSRGLYPNKRSPPPGAFPARTPEWLRDNPQTAMVYNVHAQNGAPALCMFLGGEFGDVMETCEEDQVKQWATAIIKDWLGKTISEELAIPDPVEVIRTTWRTDPNSYGSYMYIPAAKEGEEGASPLDQVECSRTLWDRVFWAGEHTEMNQYASVHGAWNSGAREAEKVLIKLNAAEVD